MGEHLPDEKCPKRRQQETAEHLMLCPNAEQMRLLKEQVGKLQEWLVKDDNTDKELAYWIPKHLLMRGTRPFAEIGDMTDSMRKIATN